MFKIGKIKQVNNEKVDISYITTDRYKRNKDGKFIKSEYIKTLCFSIEGNLENHEYFFTFSLKCNNDVLLKMPYNEKINLKDYLLSSELYFNIDEITDLNPELEIIIIRYVKNCFIVHAKIFTDTGYNKEQYASIIEFNFNLDDYL